jgi:hypothetical protein
MRELKNIYRILVGKPGGKTPLGRNGYRRDVNTEMDLKERGRCKLHPIFVAKGKAHWRGF